MNDRAFRDVGPTIVQELSLILHGYDVVVEALCIALLIGASKRMTAHHVR